MFSTMDAGTTWKQLSTNLTAASLTAVSFTDARNGTVVGNGTILRTSDGGGSWISQWPVPFYTFNAVSFTEANRGTVVGANFTNNGSRDQGRILGTTDGGATWNLQYARARTKRSFLH